MTRRRAAAASGAALLLAGLAAGAIVAAQPAAPQGRHRIVEGWLVEAAPEEDGGRLVRISRTSGPYRLEYRAAYWRGNDGVIQRVSALAADCGGDEELDRHLIYHVSEIRARLAAGLAQCAARPSAVRAALRGLEPAYLQALAWDREAAAAEAAESEIPPIVGPDDPEANAACSVAETPDRDVTEMNAAEAVSAAC